MGMWDPVTGRLLQARAAIETGENRTDARGRSGARPPILTHRVTNAAMIAAPLLVLDLAVHPPGRPLERVLHAPALT
jgi:hypothetical protein